LPEGSCDKVAGTGRQVNLLGGATDGGGPLWVREKSTTGLGTPLSSSWVRIIPEVAFTGSIKRANPRNRNRKSTEGGSKVTLAIRLDHRGV